MTGQPPPSPNSHPAVWPLVIADMEERDRVGRERYGVPLQPFNGRDQLRDAYEECLDLAVYLRAVIAERDSATIPDSDCPEADQYVRKLRRKRSCPDRPTWFDVRDAFAAGMGARQEQ